MTLQPSQIPPAIAALHAAYENIAGYKVTPTWQMLQDWRTFMAYRQPPFVPEDIGVVVRYIRKNHDKKFHFGMLRFSNLIPCPNRFEEYLNAAICEMRPRQPKTKTIIANNTSRIVDNPGTGDATVSMEQVIAEMRKAANARA